MNIIRVELVIRLVAPFVWITAVPSVAAAQLRAVPYVTGLSLPVAFVQDPSNPAIQFVVQQEGLVRVISNGVLQPTPFLDLSTLVSLDGGERGLLGLAFPADYATTRRFYVNYTRAGDGYTVVSRYKRSTGNPLLTDPGTRFDLQWPSGSSTAGFIVQPYANHNGGNLVFGPDGYLYIGMGDGGGADDPQNNAQNPGSLLGKILRVDVSVPDGDSRGYTIPADNPFVDSVPIRALGEIWAFGVRNPWKFSFDTGTEGTNALLIADVGQGSWEEIDYEPANSGGRNYGWSRYEGTHDEVVSVVPAYQPVTNPIFEYDHTVGSSITGGFVYRGTVMRRAIRGRYFFADFVRGRVWSLGLSLNGTTVEATAAGMVEHTTEMGGSAALGAISSFGRDAQGELYIVSYAGTIFKIVDVTPPGDVQTVLFNYNGDAFKDLLLYNRTTGVWVIELGNAQGLFDEGPSGGWALGWQIYAADFNADGFDDLFLYSPQTGVFYKVTNNAGSSFSYFTQGWQPGFNIYIADLNGDGKSDVFVYNPVTGVWFTCISTGTGTGGFDYGTGRWAALWRIAPGDFNGDGRTDLLLYDPLGGAYYKAISNGAGDFSYSGGAWAAGWTPLVTDLNGDGHADVFLYNGVTGVWYRCLSTGSGVDGFTYVVGQWAPGWIVQAANFDGDTRSDLFLYQPASGAWYKTINDGSTFTYFAGTWARWTTTMGDLDGNGRTDVFLYDPSSGVWYQARTTTAGAFAYSVGTFH